MAEPKLKVAADGRSALSFVLLVREEYWLGTKKYRKSFMLSVFMRSQEGRLPTIATGDNIIVTGRISYRQKNDNPYMERDHYLIADQLVRVGKDKQYKEYE